MYAFCKWLLIAVVAISFDGLAQGPAQSQVCKDDDYAIFGAVLNKLYGSAKIERMVLLDLTVTLPSNISTPSPLPNKVLSFFGEVPHDAQQDFRERNSSRSKVDAGKIRVPFICLSLSSEEVREVFRRQDGWGLFHEKYATAPGIIGFSLPGFNGEHDRAVLYMQISCGQLCGGASLVSFSKDKGRWKVDGTVTVLQS
jgi:hypothetical protein